MVENMLQQECLSFAKMMIGLKRIFFIPAFQLYSSLKPSTRRSGWKRERANALKRLYNRTDVLSSQHSAKFSSALEEMRRENSEQNIFKGAMPDDETAT